MIAVLIPIITIEVYSRIKYLYDPPVPVGLKFLHQELGDKASEFIDPEGKGGTKYYDYHLYATVPYKSKTATFTEYYSARSVPDSYPLGEGDIIVWLFGGSTMQNLETIDKLTIANSLAYNLKKSGIKASVFNFGVGSFQSSLESIKFQDLLRRTSFSERPNFVIFYDGNNDAGHSYLYGAGNLQNDLSQKMEALVTENRPKLLVYFVSSIFSRFSYFWKDYVKRRIDAVLFRNPGPYNNKQNLVKGVEMYVNNTRMIRSICKEFHIKPVFILQPVIFSKRNPTSFEISVVKSSDQQELKFMEKFYKMVRQKMQYYDDFEDLSHVLDNSKRNDFYDRGHTGPYTGVDIGLHLSQAVARRVLKKVNG